MKIWYKKEQDWKIKNPCLLETVILSEDMGCPEDCIENGLEIWKKGGLNEVPKTDVSNIEPEATKIVRATSKKKSQKKR